MRSSTSGTPIGPRSFADELTYHQNVRLGLINVAGRPNAAEAPTEPEEPLA